MNLEQAKTIQSVYGGEIERAENGHRIVVTGENTVTVFDTKGIHVWNSHMAWCLTKEPDIVISPEA